ncbi:unnamed protein product, partial [marine sediment metagenome]
MRGWEDLIMSGSPEDPAPLRSRTSRQWKIDTESDLAGLPTDELAQLDAIIEADLADSETFVTFTALCDELSTPPPPDMTVHLSGQGMTGAGCGEKEEFRCRNCGTVFIGDHHCMGRDCPRCAGLWARREARIGTNLAIAKYRARRSHGDKLIHAVISVRGEPDEIYPRRRWAIKRFKRHGLVGFFIIPHHVRMGPEDEWVPDGYIHYHAIGVIPRSGFLTIPALEQ